MANKRRTKYVANTSEPEWQQSVTYQLPAGGLAGKFLEFTVWDYDKYNDNNCLGQVVLPLSGECFKPVFGRYRLDRARSSGF